ncbi:MAG: PHP domain-containing protein, partial [FCB group bacterium]|nr:PHP domain-containing protein [FCB group bacterium]
MSAGFVHLHVHSEYSVLDGASKVDELIARSKQYGMTACALTDHGSLFGAVDFYEAARKAGIKPIIGAELYVAKNGRFDRSARSSGAASNHFLLLCENETGYHNLCRLSSLGYLEGFHYRPRVDDELLYQYREGLIATSACLAGAIPQALLHDDIETANKVAQKYIDIYGKDNFLIELMEHGMPEQQKVNPLLVELADRHGLMVIATNDCHYTDKTDAEAHDALLCIQTNAMVDNEERFRFSSSNFYFCSGDEMREKFERWPEAVANTEKVAERLDVKL